MSVYVIIDLDSFMCKRSNKELYDFLSSKGFNTSGDDIKWNFTKFLVSKEGKVISRFAPTFEPEKIEDQIKELINQK